MFLNFKDLETLNSRMSDVINDDKIDDKIKIQIRDEIENCAKFTIFDLKSHLHSEQTRNDICSDLEMISKIIDLKYSFLHDLFVSFQLSFILFNLLEIEQFVYDDKIAASIYRCIAKLLYYEDLQLFFIQNGIIKSALKLASHECNEISKESLHILSQLTKYIANQNIPIKSKYIDYICRNLVLSDEHKEYSMKFFLLFSKYSNNKKILDPALPFIFDLYYSLDNTEEIIEKRQNLPPIFTNHYDQSIWNSDLDHTYNHNYDKIKKYIIKTLYYILQSDFSFYYPYKPYFIKLFYSINGLPTTGPSSNFKKERKKSGGASFLTYIFKILLLVIDNDEKEALNAVKCIGNLEKERNVNKIFFYYDIYYLFLQNLEFNDTELLLKIMIFDLFHLPPSFYEFCCHPEFVKSLIDFFIENSPFLIKTIILRFILVLMQPPNIPKIIEVLIDNEFILKASSVLDIDDDSILCYLMIINKMIQHLIITNNKVEYIIDVINQSPEIYENIDRIIDQFSTELDELGDLQNSNNSNGNDNDQKKILEQFNKKRQILALSNQLKKFCLKDKDN